MDPERLAKGMKALGDAFNRPITEDVVELYRRVLGPKLNDEQWTRAIRRVLEAETYFPPPAVLLRYGVSEATPPTSLAGRAYQQIVESYETGQGYNYRQVMERIGRAAGEAFMAAGGHRAFAWCEPKDEPFRRRDFTAAYVEQVVADPALSLPAGPEPQALPPGEPPVTASRIDGKAAASLLGRIHTIAEGVEGRKLPAFATGQMPKPGRVSAGGRKEG